MRWLTNKISKKNKKHIQLHIFLAQVKRHGLSSLGKWHYGRWRKRWRLSSGYSSLHKKQTKESWLLCRHFEWEHGNMSFAMMSRTHLRSIDPFEAFCCVESEGLGRGYARSWLAYMFPGSAHPKSPSPITHLTWLQQPAMFSQGTAMSWT